jgi:hypothetical protein
MRKDLERFVYAWNTPLKEVVSKMDIVTLLRNAHPSYRSEFASGLRSEGLLSSEDAKEFIVYKR